MRQGRGGQRSKKSGCSRRGGGTGSGNSNSGPSVALVASLVDDSISGPGNSTAAVAAAAAASAAATASSWKPTGSDPFGMVYVGGSVGPGNGVPYQQQGGHQSPSLFHQQQGSPVPGSTYSNNNVGNNTPQHQQQHYSPSTPGGGGSSTPVPYSVGPGTPNSQHGGGQFNNGSVGSVAQMPFGSPSSVSSGGGGSGFVSGPGSSRPGTGPPQSSPFGNQQFYSGSGPMPSGSPFSQQQQIMNHHGATGGMINAVDSGPGGRMIVDHPSCFPSSMVGGRRSYGGYSGSMGGPSSNLGGSVHHSASTGHHGMPPSVPHHSSHHSGLPGGNGLPHHGGVVPLHSHGSGAGGPSHVSSHHPHPHHGGPHGPALPPHLLPQQAHHVQPDYKIFELNKRLQNRSEDSDNVWWDQFATEFFEDDATLTLTFCLEDGPKRYSIGRTLIPRYFRSIFEGGVTDLYYHLRANTTKESFHNTSLTLDCDHCTMITTHFTSIAGCGAPSSIVQSPGSGSGLPPASQNGSNGSIQKSLVAQGPPSSQQSVLGSGAGGPPSPPVFTRVCTEGRLTLEFTYDDMMRIRTWHLAVRQHKELILRSTAAATIAALVVLQQGGNEGGPPPPNAEIVHQQIAKNITRQGITNSTLNYLRLCVILEPMQELMSRHKAYALSPRDCLKTTLFQKWQRMIAPPESQRPANKRRKRKGSNSGSGGPPNTPGSGGPSSGTNGGPTAASKKRSPGPNISGSGAAGTGFNLVSQDVMVVGEPSLMGGEFGDEDERLITRLENTQYDATAVNSVTVMGISGAPGSVSSVGGNDNMPHISAGSVSGGSGTMVPISSGSLMSGEPLFPPPGSGADGRPGTPTGNISQSNSNSLQQQQNSWATGSSGSSGPPNIGNNQQQGSGGTSVSGGNTNPGNNGPPCNSNSSVGDSMSSGGGDKKSPMSACAQQQH